MISLLEMEVVVEIKYDTMVPKNTNGTLEMTTVSQTRSQSFSFNLDRPLLKLNSIFTNGFVLQKNLVLDDSADSESHHVEL